MDSKMPLPCRIYLRAITSNNQIQRVSKETRIVRHGMAVQVVFFITALIFAWSACYLNYLLY